MKKNQIALISALSLVVILLFGCKTSQKVGVLDIPKGYFAFIEFYQTQESEVIEGKSFPGPHIHGPTYTFSKELGTISALHANINPDSLNILMGKGLVLRGAKGGGIKTELIPYHNLPIEDGMLTVKEILSEEVRMTWNDTLVTLNVDQPFIHTSTHIDTLEIMDHRTIIKNTTLYHIVYHGILNKQNLLFD